MRPNTLSNISFTNWWLKFAKDEQLIVQPKIKGLVVLLRYKYGQLVGVFKSNKENIKSSTEKIKSIPSLIDVSRKVEVEIIGTIYEEPKVFTNSKEELDKENTNKELLTFIAFESTNSDVDRLTDLARLENWGFETPITLRTDDPKQVESLYQKWLAGEIFTSYPTNGIICKANSAKEKLVFELTP